MGYSPRQKSITLSMETAGKATRMLSRFVYHITGAAVMVLALHSFHAILIKNDSSLPMAANPASLSKLESFAMNGLEINVGYVEENIIALADDENDSYSFIAVKTDKAYETKMQSAYYGLATRQAYALDFGVRQMIVSHLAHHWTAIDEHYAEMTKKKANEAHESDPGLN